MDVRMRVTLEQDSEKLSDKPFFFPLGIGFLFLAKAKYHLEGYTPKPPLKSADERIDYDIKIAESYLSALTRRGVSIVGKDVLELGPGEDLGLGAYLLSKGAKSYRAFDLHPNASRASSELYERMHARGILFDRSKLDLTVCPEFSLIKKLPSSSADIILSNAAFEHFDDPERVLRELTWVARSGAVLNASVDLQTHSRWIREHDPNNIYRYPDWLYRLFRFPGQPNRIRTAQYMKFLSQAGWKNVDIVPNSGTAQPNHARVHKQFRHCDDLHVLEFTMFARRA
jgi:SAM-dependent methyltransferase